MIVSQILAQTSAVTYRVGQWESLVGGQWLLLLLAIVAALVYVITVYRRDSVELPRGLGVLLCLLRLGALAGILCFFLHLEKRTERNLVKNSRAILLVDTSQSMSLRDQENMSLRDNKNVSPRDNEKTTGSGGAAVPSRMEQVVRELAGGDLIPGLRKQHDVTVYRFDQGENPVAVATFLKKPSGDDGDLLSSEEDRRAAELTTARRTALVALSLFLTATALGAVHWFTGRKATPAESTAWFLLAGMVLLIASLVVLAVATLRSPELGLPAIVGWGSPAVEEGVPAPAAIAPEEPPVDWAAQLIPRGVSTRIGDNLKYLIDRERGGPLAGVILFSDGGENEGAPADVAASAAAAALTPVFTVGLGSDKRPPNLRVVDLEAPQRVFPGDKFTLTGYVQAVATDRTSVSVELFSSDEKGQQEKKEDERIVDLGAGGQIMPVKFEVAPREKGIRVFKLRVQRLPEEDPLDNEKTAKVELQDRKTKVLLVAGGPTREFIFLRNQLYRDKEATVDVLLQSGRPGISQEAHDILQKFPASADELFEYDCIVAFDPDWESLDEPQARLLDRWVAEKGGGLVVVAGPVFTPQWSARRKGDPRIDIIKALYPVAFYYQGSATLSLGRFGSAQAWPLTFTRDGEEAEFLWLDDDAEKSRRVREAFGGVYGYYAVKDPKPGARVYARFSDPETLIDNELPIYMAGHFYGAGRVFFQASGEMWRIRALNESYFETYYTKLIRWVSEGRRMRDSHRGVLLVDKDRCLVGDQINVRAVLQDAQHQPLAQNEVTAAVVQPDGKRQSLLLKKVKDAAREGMYAEQFTALLAGDYRVELQLPGAGADLLSREVRANIPIRETERPQRNDPLLLSLAERTGGAYFVGIDAALNRTGGGQLGVVNRLKPQDQVTPLPGVPDRNFDRLLMTWLMTFICGFLCLEWLLRRLSKLA